MNNDTETNETLLAVCIKVSKQERVIGAAFVNLHERKFLITEFVDNEHFSGLESLVIQQNNQAADSKFKVIVHTIGDPMRDKVTDVMQMCEVEFAFAQDKKDWDAKHISLSLDQLLKQSFAFMIEESKMELALSALNAAIEAMRLASYETKKNYTLSKYTLD
jgi:DNA mismatch repair protein MSH2